MNWLDFFSYYNLNTKIRNDAVEPENVCDHCLKRAYAHLMSRQRQVYAIVVQLVFLRVSSSSSICVSSELILSSLLRHVQV